MRTMNIAKSSLFSTPCWLVGATLFGLSAGGCLPTSHAVEKATLGVSRSGTSLEAVVDTPGPVTVETVLAADWEVPLSGLLNLEHPKARAANLKDRSEPIQIYLHAVRHPTHGLFIVDSGVEKALRDDPDHAAIRGLVARFMHPELMKIHHDTGTWLGAQKEPLAGVFLTHLHLDHVTGMPDVPRGTPIYAGPGETAGRKFENLFVAPVIDRTLDGQGPVREWAYSPDPSGSFAGVIDVFGDGSFWALHVPGHTTGMTSYLARTPGGPVLLVGDACHTAWGWDNQVEPGEFSSDKPTSVESLARLQRFVARHSSIDVRLGHQPMSKPDPKSARN
jgi:N-acyl homoserine lactone hydrolase